MRDFGKRRSFGDRGGSGGGGRFGGDRPRFGGDRPRFGGSPMDDQPKPVNVGEEYDVEVTETGSKGDGIARIKNFVVFIPGTSKGDKVKVKIKELRGRSAVGEVVGSEGSSGSSGSTSEESAEGGEDADEGEEEES